MSKYRWIMYSNQDIPGGMTFDLTRHPSLREAVKFYREYCEAVFTDECSARLYLYFEEDWSSALDFKDSGCPFDYPAKLIERGPRNGVVIVNA